ncbi:MAG: glycosyltransferase family 4 protein [Roseburia sp.]|nr:glycosyltransferase family 4 protein [Roseburia sp.]
MNIKAQMKSLLRKLHLEKIGEEQFISDINKDCSKDQKKILISYLDYQRTVRELRQNFGHTNRQEMMQMIKVCIENDWCIDVCGCNDSYAKEQIPADYYDYILGFGENFKYAKEKNPKAFAILYMTENPYHISYQREMERIHYFKERTGRDFHLERTGVYYQKDDEKKADAVICLGDEKYFPADKKVVRIWPSALKNPTFTLDFSRKEKKNFLVYGVDGFIHKGNDILLEIFAKHPDWNLYLCGGRGAEKAKEAGYQLPPNVHAVGFVDTLSEQFNEIAGKCYYLLLPSCSEAPSTAVLTGMRHGLLPVVSKGIGLDGLGEYCRYFEDYHLEAVEELLQKLVSDDVIQEKLQAQSRDAMEYADVHYELTDYTEGLREALQKLT